uniref:Zinc transporter ZIP11 n=1 Tax=Caenorhabditis japonica TaxID=281687 RepID=A0A8R1DYQ6_CAEJA
MIRGINPIYQALLAATFTWGVTALGASLVFVMRHQSKKLLDVSLGFAAGVMTAASFWSLLAPAIEIAEADFEKYAFVPVAIGFAVGAGFVHLADTLLPSCVGEAGMASMLAPPAPRSDTEMSLMPDREDLDVAALARSVNEEHRERDKQSDVGNDRPDVIPKLLQEQDFRQSWRRILLLILAVTVHNIPEGLAVGVGFGSAGKTKQATFESAKNLAIGIGLQNFPEGLAVSLPLAAFGHSKLKAFWYGQLSGMVEPIAALLGAAAVIFMEPVLPYALAFAAGAMIYVVVDDIIPEAQRNGNGKLASLGCIVGFLVMMSMDVGLG